jgi:photosystem II stability/assembly factor-like uncharacterized protein
MNIRSKILGRLMPSMLLALLAPPAPTLAQESGEALDIEYAEIEPLATESLLLDVIRAPNGHLLAVGERGHVVLSEQGDEWRQARVVPTRSTLTTVESSGGRLWAAGHDTVIITSGDGGETWTRQYFDPERQQPVMDLLFSDGRNGVAIGAYGLYMTTDDGGETWLDEVIDEENEYHLNDMVRFDDGRRLIAGEAGYSYRSFDDGASWEPLDVPYLGSMWGAQQVGAGCVLFFGLRGHILETCDFGDNWTEVRADTIASLSGAAYDQGQTVIVGNGGAILVREDDGPFAVRVHTSGVDFASNLALGGGRFILVGEDGTYHFPEAPEVNGAQGEEGR